MLNFNSNQQVVLETEITNRPALRLYENLGFVRDKRLFRYYLNGVDALRLKLWLRWNCSCLLVLVMPNYKSSHYWFVIVIFILPLFVMCNLLNKSVYKSKHLIIYLYSLNNTRYLFMKANWFHMFMANNFFYHLFCCIGEVCWKLCYRFVYFLFLNVDITCFLLCHFFIILSNLWRVCYIFILFCYSRCKSVLSVIEIFVHQFQFYLILSSRL